MAEKMIKWDYYSFQEIVKVLNMREKCKIIVPYYTYCF